MSATQSQTATTDQTNPPEIKIFTRVASIPMISSSLESINYVLTSNILTRQPYAHAKVFSNTAYRLTEPLQVRLAPLIVRADGFANKAVDVVESRYPYPFQVQPQEVVTFVIASKDNTINGVGKAIGDNVTTPAMNVAQGIDNRFAPIVDYFANAVSKFNHSDAGPSTAPDVKYQYQRAFVLSKTVGENLVDYTSDQLKQFHAQSAISQKATEIAHSITSAASSSLTSAQSQVHTLSDTMINELQKLHDSTSNLAASLQSGVQGSASQIHQAYDEISTALLETVHNLATIVKEKDRPVQEKMSRVGKEVQNRVTPILDIVKKTASDVLARSKETAPTGGANGHATSESNGQ